MELGQGNEMGKPVSEGYIGRADKKSQRTKAEKRVGEEGARRVTKTKTKP